MAETDPAPDGRGRSNANLVLWRAGHSGNPGGRPKRSLKSILREMLAREGADGLTAADLLIASMLKRAIETADPALIRMILDRHDGPIQAKTKAEDRHGSIRVEYADEPHDPDAPETPPRPAAD